MHILYQTIIILIVLLSYEYDICVAFMTDFQNDPIYGGSTTSKKTSSIHRTTQLNSRLNIILLPHKNDMSFDFSSKLGWEEYYQKNIEIDGSHIVEWHSSIPLEIIADYCPPSHIHKKSNDTADINDQSNSEYQCNILMVGCGTSRLVDVLFQHHQRVYDPGMMNTHITLFDSSMTCIKQLQHRYAKHPYRDYIYYICGDAVELSSSLSRQPLQHDSISSKNDKFDYIIDKGFMDTLFCGDDWSTPLTKLLYDIPNVLNPMNSGSVYILVSYKLPTATKQFIIDTCKHLPLQWEFHCAESNDRVSISIARMVELRC